MAKKIEAAQTAEIDQMKDMLKRWSDNQTSSNMEDLLKSGRAAVRRHRDQGRQRTAALAATRRWGRIAGVDPRRARVPVDREVIS